MTDLHDQFHRVLGAELRRARDGRHLSRIDVSDALDRTITWQSVRAYEIAERRCPLINFVEVCRAIGERPDALLGRAYDAVYGRGNWIKDSLDQHPE